MNVKRSAIVSRRRFLATTSAAGALSLAAPYVRTAHAAGSLSIGLWDHWVPGANEVASTLIKEWGEKEKVDVQIDFITSQANKLILTLAAEYQAKAGHDVMDFNTWEPHQYKDALENVDDVVGEIIAQNGNVSEASAYTGKADGHWVVVPSTRGSLTLPCCTRFDLLKEHAGIDVQAMYPADAEPTASVANWTWDTFLVAAQKLHKAGYAFGLPMGTTTDTQNWVGALFRSFGADLVDASGKITVKTDAVRKVLDYGKTLMQYLPPDVPAWDDAGNNKWLISGKGSLIMNPPSAWAVAKRDAPQVAEKCWTHGMPKGEQGRFVPFLPRYLGIWQFAKNKAAAKSLIKALAMRGPAEKLVAASQGYDLPPYAKLRDFKTWSEEGPPKGSIYHYVTRGDQVDIVVCSPAPPAIALQIFSQAIQPKMVVRYAKGEPMETTLAWAQSECEGYMRT